MKVKFSRNRKKFFPRTVIVKISEASFENILNLCEKFNVNKSEILRDVIEYGVADKFKEKK